MSDKYEDYAWIWMAENQKAVQACATMASLVNDDSFRLAIRLATEHYGKWLAERLEKDHERIVEPQ